MKVKIYRKEVIASQHHGSENGPWIIEFVGIKKGQEKNLFISEEMKWHGSNDMYTSEVMLEFPNLDDAKKFADQNNYIYELISPQKKEYKKKNYLDEFKNNFN